MSKGHASGGHVLMEAEALLLRGDIARARILGYRARHEAALTAQASILIGVDFLFGRLAILRGDAAAFADALESMERIVDQYPQRSNRVAKDMAHSFLMSLIQRPLDMSEWLRESSTDTFAKRLFVQARPFADLCRASFLLLTGKPEAMLGESEATVALASAQRYILALIYSHIHRVAAWVMCGDSRSATEFLREALDLAVPDGLLLPFAENHSLIKEPLLALLSDESDKYAALTETVSELTRQMEAGRLVIADSLYAIRKRFGFTRREYEVAVLAADGLSSDRIARRLHISLNTVKTHLKTVYRKTDTSSRFNLKKKLES
jgi:LuxR family maltose regulon positive regulatory protein